MTFFNRLTKGKMLFLAPIAGYTDSPFRCIALKHGSGPVMTELISAEGLARGNEKSLDMLRFNDDERPIGIQIFGNSPEVMGSAAAVVNEYEPDFININIGCPSKKVTGIGAGAALLTDPGKIEEITRSVQENSKIPVSAKIRIGWDENSKNYMDVVKALEAGGVSFIIVHGRTASQKYAGKADWEIISEINERSSVPVVGNGDINSFEQAQERISSSDCPAVMIGRSAIGNPWIFSGEKPSLNAIVDQIKEHIDLMTDFYGEYGLILIRKHITRYIYGIRNASTYRKKLITSSSRNEIFEVLDSLEEE